MEGLLRVWYGVFRWSVLTISRWFGPSEEIDEMIPDSFDVGTIGGEFAQVLFLPSKHERTAYHLVVMLHMRTNIWFVDPGDHLSIVPSRKEVTDRLVSMLNPDYIVKVPMVFSSHGMPMLAEPYSCVTMVRSILNINEPLIHTPEQLLNYLWRKALWAE